MSVEKVPFRLEDQVPETHLLRLIDRHVNFEFVRAKLKDCYSDTGRPSTDPELLLRALLIGYLYGVTSERKLVQELRMHLGWRWFTGLGFDQRCVWYPDPRKALFQHQSQQQLRVLAIGLLPAHSLGADLGCFPTHSSNCNSRSKPSNQRECPLASMPIRTLKHCSLSSR